MERKDKIDTFGAVSLVAFGIVLAVNQVVVKLGNGGFQPVFMAGLRSVGAVIVLIAWMRLRGIPFDFRKGTLGPGLLLGALFAQEFVALFWALDHTSVSHASLLFYTMPVILSIAAHFLLPGERLTSLRVLGLVLAMGGVALVLGGHRGGQATLAGDLAALSGAFGWAGIALVLRLSRLSTVRPEMQLFWQLSVSAVILLAVSPMFGPFLRDPGMWHFMGLAYQILAVASFGFLFWVFLISIYPASGVASFAFLTPVLSVTLGWLLLGEEMGWNVIGAMVLVALGIVLINRKKRPA
ncbi:DMT family transporter [Thalassobius vesicularis]|uniref:DMT family transporter n=1 Tax=Thalassobius vesicularis TaxID=1294297 RepID=A0A4S3M7Z0_9RHOB|nr:DMT family transporter [Thalassobius vesicularis]THD73462.1 DMT family transporter [Thalassobius vesicularis]